MITFTKGCTKLAGLILAVSVPLISTQAHAVSVSVNEKIYELSVVNTSYSANTLLLQSQPWWGSLSLAGTFSTAAGNIGGRFAFTTFSGELGVDFLTNNSSTNSISGDRQTSTSNYVIASASSVPEINAGSLSQALLILFALWLVTWRRTASHVA